MPWMKQETDRISVGLLSFALPADRRVCRAREASRRFRAGFRIGATASNSKKLRPGERVGEKSLSEAESIPAFLRLALVWGQPLCAQKLCERAGGQARLQDAGSIPALPRQVRLSKNPKESARGRKPFRTSIVPGGVYAGGGRFFRRKISFSRGKIGSLQSPRPEIFQDFSGDWRGWPWRGRDSPVHQLVKKPFLTSCGGHRPPLKWESLRARLSAAGE